MADENRPRRYAVLIDADNASPLVAPGLFEEVAKLGEATVRRIYGDFSSPRLKGWADIIQTYAIIPCQQFAYTQGKNASDITLVIDAMDLLHGGLLDGFCLVSSDSDFTRLASRLRENGADVHGFGEQKTPESLRHACRRFIYTENLISARTDLREGNLAAPAVLQPIAVAIDLLQAAVAQVDSGDDGWVNLGAVGSHLFKIAPDFDPRTYGCRKLGDLVRKAGAFEVKNEGLSLLIKAAVAPTSVPAVR